MPERPEEASPLLLRHYRPIAVFIVGLLFAGCYKWEPVPTGVARPVIEQEGDRSVRVTLRDGREVEIENARVTIDSIYGMLDECERVAGTDGQLTCRTESHSLDDVASLSLQRLKPAESFLTGVVLGAGTFMLFALVAMSTADR